MASNAKKYRRSERKKQRKARKRLNQRLKNKYGHELVAAPQGDSEPSSVGPAPPRAEESGYPPGAWLGPGARERVHTAAAESAAQAGPGQAGPSGRPRWRTGGSQAWPSGGGRAAGTVRRPAFSASSRSPHDARLAEPCGGGRGRVVATSSRAVAMRRSSPARGAAPPSASVQRAAAGLLGRPVRTPRRRVPEDYAQWLRQLGLRSL